MRVDDAQGTESGRSQSDLAMLLARGTARLAVLLARGSARVDGVGEMMRRLRWFWLIAAAGCYFETPTHESTGLDDAASNVGLSAEAGSETEAGEGEPAGAGTDGALDGQGEAGADKLDASGSTDAGPACDCDASKPMCLPGTAQCVECLQDSDCPGAAKARCDSATHSCEPCTSKPQCAHVAGLNACGGGSCVECTSSDAAACTGTAKPLCASTGNVCVACNVNQDCSDPAKPTCDAHACRPCGNDSDCAGKVNGTTALDACSDGQCVDCRINSSDTKKDYGCTNNIACNPASRTCDGATKNTLDICTPCVADSECIAGHRCVALTFNAMSVGGYCMKVSPGCSEPYAAAQLSRPSLSGAAATNYCGITEMTTSCEAIKALQAFGTCAGNDADACQAQGALCKTVNGAANRCTYRCATSADCPTNSPCSGTAGAQYCGG